jgi:hypothetical protein
MPADTQQAFKVMYLETAKQLQEKIDKNEAVIPEVEQLHQGGCQFLKY